MKPMPPVVDQQSWQQAVDELRQQEKALTRASDAVNAARRRLPMVKLEKNYELEGESGRVSLGDLFEGRSQLIVYHFMFGPDWDAGCPGCSWVVDAMSHPAHLNSRDISLALVSRAPLDSLLSYRSRMGWQLPWYSSLGSDFNFDMGATNDHGENHMTSVFLKSEQGDDIYRTYYTEHRGVEYFGSHFTYLDLTPYGRQEHWEDSPEGWPKGEKYWNRRHDEYNN